MTYEIPEDLVKGILSYLAGRPYAEVAGAIQQLQTLKPIQLEKPVEKK